MNPLTTTPFDPAAVSQALWLIIALPVLGAIICGLFGRNLGRANVHLVACGSVAGSFLVSAITFWTIQARSSVINSAFSLEPIRYAVGHDFGTWFSAGGFTVHLGLAADHLSGAMLLVITGVGFLIHVYSSSYMEHDDGYWRFFAYLNLFVAMMLTLVLADSLPLMFVGWEGVGLCSYLLIGFWYTDPAKAFAGRKAFVTNRIGDFGLLVGMFLLVLLVDAFGRQATSANFTTPGAAAAWREGVSQVGPLSFQAIEQLARGLPANPAGDAVSLASAIEAGPLAGKTFGGVLTCILLLFLLGAAGKSAQLPLYVWLPDAMAGPTPVSALIHAATMVTAGVYLFCRLSYLLVLSPTAMAVTAIIGALTALLAALIAFAQNDIKKVLAYSTVSQLGLMFLGVGMGVFWAAFLHVVTHAFFKACLFLGAGSVMHGNGDETDIKKLGGLRRDMPVTHITFLISTLAITGIVPLSGFFSKDAILHGVHSTHLEGYGWVTNVVWILGLTTALCTAFYMTRLYVLTFWMPRSPEAKSQHAHESAFPMVMPLVVLAALAVIFTIHGIPWMKLSNGVHQTPMENFLSPVFRVTDALVRDGGLVTVHHSPLAPAWVMAWLIAAIGGISAFFCYTRLFPSWKGATPSIARAARSLAYNKFYVDELYELIIIKPIKFVSFIFFKIIDSLLIDTVLVRGTAWVTARVGSGLRYLQTGDVQSYAAVMALALIGGMAYAVFRVIQ
jgi:NADH-quinone oxidoreductase subunit L